MLGRRKRRRGLIRQRTIVVPVYDAMECERMCREPDAANGRDEPVYQRTVDFTDDLSVIVQLVASTEPAKESCWTQAVLRDSQGNELDMTDVGDSFLGEYALRYDGVHYDVQVETDMRTHYPHGDCPDCGEDIDRLAVDGSACHNCGHVFYAPRENDDAGQKNIFTSDG